MFRWNTSETQIWSFALFCHLLVKHFLKASYQIWWKKQKNQKKTFVILELSKYALEWCYKVFIHDHFQKMSFNLHLNVFHIRNICLQFIVKEWRNDWCKWTICCVNSNVRNRKSYCWKSKSKKTKCTHYHYQKTFENWPLFENSQFSVKYKCHIFESLLGTLSI